MRVRAWFGVTAALAAVAVAVQLVLAVLGDDGGLVARVVRLFSFFTIESNVLVAVVAGMLALGRARDSGGWRVAHLDSVLCITVTCLVHVIVLRPIVDFEGIDAVTDMVFHYVVPVLMVAGWLLFGPHGRWSACSLLLALIFPVCFLAWTLVRGAVVDEYPYPFIDATALGYAQALLNALGVTTLFGVLGGLLLLIDRKAARA